MVKATLLVLVVASICFAASADSLKATGLSALAEVSRQTRAAVTRGIDARQAAVNCFDIEDFAENYPSDCVDAFNALDEDKLGEFDPDEFERFGEIFCQPRCGNPLIEYFAQCIEDGGENLANFYVDICSQNEDGDRCYDSQVILALSDTASVSSCDGLETIVDTTGCCFNLLNLGGAVDTTGQLEDICDGLDIPGQCGGSTIGSNAVGVFAMSAVTFGVTALAALLLQ